MKTSILTKHQFLKSDLLSLVEISNLLKTKDRLFIIKFEEWLSACEQKLKEFSFVEASHFSVYKAGLYSCKTVKGRNKQKLLLNKSIEYLKVAHQILYNLFSPMDLKINQAEEIIENLLVLIIDTPDFKKIDKKNFSQYVNRVWLFISKNESLGNYANQLKTLISLTDIKLILGQKLPI